MTTADYAVDVMSFRADLRTKEGTAITFPLSVCREGPDERLITYKRIVGLRGRIRGCRKNGALNYAEDGVIHRLRRLRPSDSAEVVEILESERGGKV